MSYTFFGIQVATQAFFKDGFRAQLHEVIAKSDTQQTLVEKRQFWKRLCAVVNEAMPVFALGHWDLIRGDNAEEEFETWCSEIEGSVATEAEELGQQANEANRLSAKSSYVLITLLFLVEAGSPADDTLGERCDLPKDEWLTRATFARLIATIPMLNFAHVQADAAYVVPGNDADGLSDEDLHGGGYEYLQPLT